MAELTSRPNNTARAQYLDRRDLLRWLYVGRLTFVTGVYAGALLTWFTASDESTLIATGVFLVAFIVTPLSFWFTHVLGRKPGENFLYAQIILDVLLVTAVIHGTGGPSSNLAPVYILVISAGALLLPFRGGVLIGGLASMAYVADLWWGFGGALSSDLILQLGLFTVVAIATGLLGDRLRHTGDALGEVASELRQLRLDTGDILTSMTSGVLTVDGEGRLAYANPAAASLLGLDVGRFLNRPVLEEMERIAPGMGHVLQDSIQGRSVARYRTMVTGSGPRNVRLGVSTAVLERAEGESNSATAIFQDITELERIGELNLRNERLEAVAALSASLAHEIKNPLASIRSSVEQLGGGRLEAADRSVLQRLVLTESDRLSRLLTEFLEFSGLRIGEKQNVDLRALVQECMLLARQHPEVQAVDLRGDLDPDPVHLMGDADILHRALFNLVLNAAQSAGEGGTVVVSLANERDRSRPRGTDVEYPVRLAVRDSGPGIEPGTANRIFDPFFTTKESGSGLGLAVVHRSVEAHNGATFVERAPEGGAQFVVFLPGLPRTQEDESA